MTANQDVLSCLNSVPPVNRSWHCCADLFIAVTRFFLGCFHPGTDLPCPPKQQNYISYKIGANGKCPTIYFVYVIVPESTRVYSQQNSPEGNRNQARSTPSFCSLAYCSAASSLAASETFTSCSAFASFFWAICTAAKAFSADARASCARSFASFAFSFASFSFSFTSRFSKKSWAAFFLGLVFFGGQNRLASQRRL